MAYSRRCFLVNINCGSRAVGSGDALQQWHSSSSSPGMPIDLNSRLRCGVRGRGGGGAVQKQLGTDFYGGIIIDSSSSAG